MGLSNSIVLALIVAMTAQPPLPPAAPAFPGPAPGKAQLNAEGDQFTLQNDSLAVTWTIAEGRFRLERLTDRRTGQALELKSDAFGLLLSENQPLQAAALRLRGKPRAERLEPAGDPRSRSDRDAGQSVVVEARSPDGLLEVFWKATLRDNANYVRQELRLRAPQGPLPVAQVTFLDAAVPNAETCGTVDGSPVVAGHWFFGCEHPMAENRGGQGRLLCRAGTFARPQPGRTCQRSCVIGLAPPGQLRRAFLYYLERERPRPYQPFLHYNSWYDIAWGDRKMNEPQCLEVIEQFGRELVQRRGVKLDSLVFDDGWDDNRTLWRFHAGFPRGFTPLKETAAKYQTAIGVWLSPWGGYGKAKDQRLQYGKQEGFEISTDRFSLSGPKYYARFHEVCAEMVRKYEVNYFKFDGIGVNSAARGAAQFAPDVEALLDLLLELRRLRPDLFINVTTGTWPSPFWLGYCDSIWRSGSDMGFHGPGSVRQQWITYRDMITYRAVVGRGRMFPISSLMTQGIAHAVLGDPAKLSDDPKELADEIRSFFASGTQCQELYISPRRMTAAAWDLLAEAARWSRQHADVLADVHWIGGDPGKQQVYGFAAWSPRQGMLALRNPSPQPGSIEVDIAKAFELPEGAPRTYRLRSPWKAPAPAAEITIRAGQPHRFELAAFEVLVFDALPER